VEMKAVTVVGARPQFIKVAPIEPRCYAAKLSEDRGGNGDDVRYSGGAGFCATGGLIGVGWKDSGAGS
jgi:hypothetical protein